VITGSFNWSPSAAHQSDEVLLVIESPLLASHSMGVAWGIGGGGWAMGVSQKEMHARESISVCNN